MKRKLLLESAARAAACGLIVLGSATAAWSSGPEPDSVKVQLWNKPDGSMGLTLSKSSVHAGPVEFEIKNTSKTLLHELLIAPWHGAAAALPYDESAGKVAEEKVPGMQGAEDMKPGAEATLRLVLAPGDYVVFCNQVGHYKAGMFARFTVTR